MRLTLKQLKSLQVQTQSGTTLGHVSDVVFETSGQMVAQYVVKSSMIGGTECLVNRDQVVRFEEKKMIVDDAVAKKEEKKESKKTIHITPKPVAMRE